MVRNNVIGKTALVTGGTDGIGKEVARGLAHAGIRVIIVGRDQHKGERAAQELQQATNNENVRFVQADLSLVGEVERLALDVSDRWQALNYLVHSAGVVRGRRDMTAEGIESNFAINYLSRFALTSRLAPMLEAGGRPDQTSRIVIIGGAARNGAIYYDDVNLTANFGTLRAVGQFCQANDIFTVELARRLATVIDLKITITCLKIGVVRTNIRREFPGWMKLLVPLLDPFLAQAPQEAADSALKLLLDAEFEGVTGALFLKIRKFKRIAPGSRVLDLKAGRRLWELSEKLMAQGLSPALPKRTSPVTESEIKDAYIV